MVRIMMAAVAAAMLAGAIQARAAPASDEAAAMRDLFAGTLEVDVPAGNWSAKYLFAPDHTYRETGTDGDVRGKWVLENGKVCTMPDRGPAAPDRAARYCNRGPAMHPGDQWTDPDPVTGNTVFFTLAGGR